MSDMKTRHQTLRDNGINIDQINEDKPLLGETILSAMSEYAQLFHEFKLANDTKKEKNTLPIDIVSQRSELLKGLLDFADKKFLTSEYKHDLIVKEYLKTIL